MYHLASIRINVIKIQFLNVLNVDLFDKNTDILKIELENAIYLESFHQYIQI